MRTRSWSVIFTNDVRYIVRLIKASDFHRKDLEEDITTGVYPTWKLAIQVIPEAREHDFDFDILDATRIWPKELVRWRSLVSCVLNRTVDE